METYANWMPSIFTISADDGDDDGDTGDKEFVFPQEIKQDLNQAINQLQNIQSIQSALDVENFKSIIECLWRKGALPGFSTAEKLCNLDNDVIQWNLIADKEYADILQATAALFNTEWPRCSGDIDVANELFILNLFKIDYSFDFIYESWLCVLQHLDDKPQTTMEIFKFLIDDENFLSVTFLNVCKEKAAALKDFKDTIQSVPETKVEQFNIKAKEFLQILISLPTRFANSLKGCGVMDMFLTTNYCQIMLQHFLKSLWFLIHCDDISIYEYFDTQFLSQLVSRLVTEFCREEEMDSLLFKFVQILQELCHIPKAQNLIQNILSQINDNIATYRLYLCMLRGNINIYTVLGKCGKDNSSWNFCFMQKLALQRIPSNDQCLLGIVNYIAKLDSSCMLRELFENILHIWSKRTSLQKLSLSEHLKLSKLFVLCGKFYLCHQVGAAKRADDDQQMKQLLHEGLRHHLESTNTEQRYIGMKCVEEIFNFICSEDTKDEDRLKFDYSAILENPKGLALKEINDLLIKSEKPNECVQNINMPKLEELLESFMCLSGNKQFEDIKQMQISKTETKELNKPPPAKSPRMELDSDDDEDDDDLKPYDMSNDITQLMEKRPKFLLDLLNTLSVKCENYEIFESALSSAESLIRSQLPRSDSRLAVDLMQLFLPLDMQYFFENFEETKFQCCVAICVAHPAECSEYICRQFHTDNSCYSVNLRILMLQILSGAAKELSGVTESDDKMETEIANNRLTQELGNDHIRKFQFVNEHQKRLVAAQHIIKQRLKEKTKRYCMKLKSPAKEAKSNRFHSVVGNFFFALIRGDRTRQMLYAKYDRIAHDIDKMLMVNFLHTLSIFVMAAQNCPLLPAMTREIFDICAFVRFSPESRIRLSCLQLLGITLVTTPGYVLIEQFNDRLLDLRYWLEDFIKSPLLGGESSEECREIAGQILNTCYKLMTPSDIGVA